MINTNITVYKFSFCWNCLIFLGDKSLQVYSLDDFTEVSYSPITFFKYGVNNIRFNKTGDLLVTSDTEGSSHVLKLDRISCEVSFDFNLKKVESFMCLFFETNVICFSCNDDFNFFFFNTA